MKVNRKNFCNILNTVKVGLSNSKSLEGMLYFQFTGKDLMAYNNHILLKHEFKTDFTCFVHAGNLIKTVNNLTENKIDISVNEDKFIIKSRGIQLRLSLISDEELIERTSIILNEVKECKWYTVPKNFMQCLSLCQFAISKKESDGTLQYAYVDNTQMIASDNNRIAKTILSKKMKRMLLKHDIIPILKDLKIEKYGVTKSHIHFKTDGTYVLSVRKRIGQYPEFSTIIKNSEKGVSIVLSSDMIADLDISEIFNTEFDSSVMIKLKDNHCYITATSEAGEMYAKPKIDYTGKEIKFYINPTFLTEMLNHSTTIIYNENSIRLQNEDFVIVTALMEK